MRKMFTAALMCFNMVVNANHLNSELNISATDRSLVAVAIDQQWTGAPSRHVNIENLEPGNHWINIARYDRYLSYYPEVVYSGYVFIPECSRVVGALTMFNRFKVVNVIPLMPVGTNEVGFNNTVYQFPVQQQCHIPITISENDFALLRNSIDSKSFESTKLEIAKMAIDRYYFTTGQVAQLMRLFTFESSKVEFAKYAYAKTVDKGRYFLINDEFTFSSSISELNAFLKNNG